MLGLQLLDDLLERAQSFDAIVLESGIQESISSFFQELGRRDRLVHLVSLPVKRGDGVVVVGFTFGGFGNPEVAVGSPPSGTLLPEQCVRAPVIDDGHAPLMGRLQLGDDWRTDALFWKECSGWWRTNSDFWIAETTECETNYNDAVASFYRQRDEMDKAVAAAEFLKEAADGFPNAALKDNGIERLGALQKVIEKLKAEHPGWETNDLSSGATFPSSQGVYLARGQTRTETESCRARISSAPRPALPCLDELVWRGRDDDCAGQDAMGTVWTERRARYFRCD